MSGRIRTIKPEWLEDEVLAAASDEARVLSVALILMADDHGRGRASVASIASGAWRYQLERDDGAHAPETLARASRALRELVANRFVVLYQVAGQAYFEIRNWRKHQKVDRPGKPRVPPPPSRDPRETLASNSRDPREEQRDSDAQEPETPTITPVASESRDTREDVARPSRDPRETLATDLRPPTSDLRPRSRDGERDPREAERPEGAGSEPEPLEGQSPYGETTSDSWPTDTDSETDEPSLETQLRRGYQRRYQRETGEAWMVHARAHEPVQRVAAWARLQADPEAAIERFLDGAFADPVRASGTTDTRWRDERWPWSWLAQDPNLTCSRTKLAQRPAVNARGSSDASPAAKPPHGRPALTETEACAYERQRERARGTRTTPATKPAELTALEGAKAKGWDADADERSGWTP